MKKELNNHLFTILDGMITISNILELIMKLLAGSIFVIYFQRKEVNND